MTYDVIVAGAGPVGLTLAIDLGRRGIRCLIMEKNPTTAPWPKMDRSNARTMEFYRRIGIVDRVRALGYPPDNPMNVFLTTRLSDPPIAVLEYPSVAERRKQIAESPNGNWLLEPYQLVSQNKLEPLLKEVAEATPNVTVRYGLELTDFTQDADGVSVTARAVDGTEEAIRGSYLAGCDGGSSTVRKKLGIKLEGRGGIRQLVQVIFRSDTLYERIVTGKGRHYQFADALGSTMIAQGCRTEFTLHSTLPPDTDFVQVIQDFIGFPCDFEILHVVPWRHNLLIAERYRDRRVFLAGDAIHLVIPTGGLGMNTGVGDAFDLSWKLAGIIKGWGGPGLLDGYEQERRPIGIRNVAAAGWAAAGVPIWRALVTPAVYDNTPEGEATRRELAASFDVEHRRIHGMVGVESNYSYAGSPLIAEEPGNVAEWETSRYEPHTGPGVRIPHMWLKDGRAMQDVLGDDYTLLDLRGDCDSRPLEAAFRALGAPLEALRLDERRVREVYGASVFLLRPDLHIAWRGDGAPGDPVGLAARATGQAGA
ncbi:MAG: 2-polyprenyl-6-methoxyphenol hydroxylase [Acetobacteraceae bacterium]|nr:2-polyprenyl-6-methoxyphenol hydroxylase [Acetobacteraceae bacterium]